MNLFVTNTLAYYALLLQRGFIVLSPLLWFTIVHVSEQFSRFRDKKEKVPTKKNKLDLLFDEVRSHSGALDGLLVAAGVVDEHRVLDLGWLRDHCVQGISLRKLFLKFL
jgi:hypothetical protein